MAAISSGVARPAASSITETRYCILDHLLWFGAPLVGGLSPLLRTPLPRSDTASRISCEDFLVPRPRLRSRKTVTVTAEDDQFTLVIDGECEWLVTNGVLPADLVTRNRRVAETALRPWTPVFTHGDLQIAHVFVDGDEITGVIDWSEAGPGGGVFCLPLFSPRHEEDAW